MMPQQDSSALFATATPAVTALEAQNLAAELYGIDATASVLAGERDCNFLLSVDGNDQYVLKVCNPAEDPQVTHFQTQALLHIASWDPALPVPRVLTARDGRAEAVLARPGEEPRTVRIVSFLQGEPLYRAPRSAGQRRNLGHCLARLDLALKDFSHPATGHELIWDLKHATRVRNLLAHIPDEQRRSLAERFLDNFETHVLPIMPTLRAQVIHNDMNPHNVLVSSGNTETVVGIIDFGDAVHAPLINDLAIAAAYQTEVSGHALTAVAELVTGYNATLPLEPIEIDLLFDLIATRLVMIVAISGWRAVLHPDNREYILRNNLRAWASLERLSSLSRVEAQSYLRRACRMEERSCR